MQVGIDSFAAAFDDSSRAVSPQGRLRNLVEQIEHADQVGLDTFGVGEHHRREFVDSAPQSFSAPRLPERSAFV
jgi:alkanesulfonate monooxygenase SsuD/methylene tetrahydromethanopterin reductase-like flavin-dependent oxidoreductase (luciferase family)